MRISALHPPFPPLPSRSALHSMPEIIPIQVATTGERVVEISVEVDLTDDEMKAIDSVLTTQEVEGDLDHSFGMKLVNG